MSHLFYTTFAKYYDKIYSYHDNEKESALFNEIMKKYKTSQNSNLLDIACGTGIHAERLQEFGYKVTGVDLNEEMLEQARKKSGKVDYLQGDMKSLQIKDQFGAILCFFNSILYNRDIKELTGTLKWFFEHLEPGGVLIFDAFDKESAVKAEKEKGYTYKADDLEIVFKPEWFYDKAENKLRLEIRFEVNGKVYFDFHEMGAFTLREIKIAMEQVGFQVILLERDYNSLQPYSGKYHEAIFLGSLGLVSGKN